MTSTAEILERKRNWYEISKLGMMAFTSIAVVGLGVLIVVMLLQAQDARLEIRDCIDPKGTCAIRSAQAFQTLEGASAYCAVHLDQTATRDETLTCIRNFVLQGRQP
jgi:hypothetical protein